MHFRNNTGSKKSYLLLWSSYKRKMSSWNIKQPQCQKDTPPVSALLHLLVNSQTIQKKFACIWLPIIHSDCMQCKQFNYNLSSVFISSAERTNSFLSSSTQLDPKTRKEEPHHNIPWSSCEPKNFAWCRGWGVGKRDSKQAEMDEWWWKRIRERERTRQR